MHGIIVPVHIPESGSGSHFPCRTKKPRTGLFYSYNQCEPVSPAALPLFAGQSGLALPRLRRLSSERRRGLFAVRGYFEHPGSSRSHVISAARQDHLFRATGPVGDMEDSCSAIRRQRAMHLPRHPWHRRMDRLLQPCRSNGLLQDRRCQSMDRNAGLHERHTRLIDDVRGASCRQVQRLEII